MDRSVKPGDDFFRYVNGKWLATVKIPADKSRFGMFDALRDQAEADVRALVESLAKTPQPAGSVRQKVGDLYASFMDQARVEARGIEPLKGDLAAIAAAATKADLVRLMGRARLQRRRSASASPPIRPTRPATSSSVTQSGLGMPSRDYYLSTGPKFDGYRAAYQTYVTRLLELIGDKTPADERGGGHRARDEARRPCHWAPERRRNVKDTNNPADRAGLATMIPAIDWPAALEASGPRRRAALRRPRDDAPCATAPRCSTREPVATWRAYLAFHLADDYAEYLPKAFEDANFAFDEQGAARHRGAARALEARHAAARRPDRRRASASSTSPSTSRPATRRRWTRSSPTCAPRWASG